MSFTVTDLLASERFKNMHLLNDNCNVNAEIKRIRIVEVSDMEHFLIGGYSLINQFQSLSEGKRN